MGFRVRPLTIRLPSGAEHPIKYEPSLAGKISGLFHLFCPPFIDRSEGAVRAELAGFRQPVKDSTRRPCYAAWSGKADWCEKRGGVPAGLRRNSECNDLQRYSSRARAKDSSHGSTGFRADSSNILLGAPDQGAISRRPFERGSSSGPTARQSLPFLEGKTSHEPHDPYCYARQQW